MELSLLSEEEILSIATIRIQSEKDLENPLFGSTSGRCIYCGLHDECPGHCGYFELDTYIVNPFFEKNLNQIINNYCHSCGAKKIKRCGQCKYISPTNMKYRCNTLDMQNDDVTISSDEIMQILERINPYFKRIMIKYIIIPPSRIRSYTPEFPDLSRLSRLYSRLVASPSYKIVKDLMGSQRNSLLYDFISGKNGIFRNTALGKRVNRSGRSVIVPDPFLPVDTVALPEKIWNVMKRDAYDNVTTKYVCINRQPSLSKYSIMSFKAIKHTISDVMFINPCITPAFNADFDGDEMNIYLLDHPSSRVEMMDLIFVGNNTISYQNDLPVIYPVQDVITGCYMMTKFPIEATDVEIDEVAMLTGSNPKNYPRTSIGLLSMVFPSSFTIDPYVNKGIITCVVHKKELLHILRHVDSIIHIETIIQKVVCGWIFRHGLSATNDCLLHMIHSGSKGTVYNYNSIVNSVGKQYVNGRMVGECKSSYREGLNPDEYFKHQMAAREGVVNIGVNTAGTGYLSRRGCKKMSETVVSYENTIVDNGRIISF